jgi:hypothetical protein
MSNDGASKTLDDLLAILVEEDDTESTGLDAKKQAEMKAMVTETTALIEKLHRERTMRRLAKVEESRKKQAEGRPVKAYEGPLPSMEQLVAELRTVMHAAGQSAAFHAMKFQDARPEDVAEMIASVKHLLEGNDKK